MDRELVTQAEYARLRGVSRQMVGKWIGASKVKLHEQPDGKKLIDRVEADLALGANVDRLLSEVDDDAAIPGEVPDEDEASDDAAATAKAPAGLTAARTRNEKYKGDLAELALMQRLGKLRPVDDVLAATQLCAGTLIRAIGKMRGRGDELVARVQKDGIMGARAFLRDLERDLLLASSGAFAKLAAGELPDDDGPEADETLT